MHMAYASMHICIIYAICISYACMFMFRPLPLLRDYALRCALHAEGHTRMCFVNYTLHSTLD